MVPHFPSFFSFPGSPRPSILTPPLLLTLGCHPCFPLHWENRSHHKIACSCSPIVSPSWWQWRGSSAPLYVYICASTPLPLQYSWASLQHVFSIPHHHISLLTARSFPPAYKRAAMSSILTLPEHCPIFPLQQNSLSTPSFPHFLSSYFLLNSPVGLLSPPLNWNSSRQSYQWFPCCQRNVIFCLQIT